MNEEERKQKEGELETLRKAADAAHQAAAETPGDETLLKAAEDAEDAYNALKAELDAAPPAPSSEEGEEDLEKEGDELDIDFEKELKDLEGNGKPPQSGKPPVTRSELEKATRALHFNAKRVRELGGDPKKVLEPKDDDTLDEEPPAPPAPVREETDPRYVTKDDLAEQEAAKLSGSEAQRKVIMWHYKNSIVRTGNVIADVENSFFIANKGRIRRSIDEIRRASSARPAPGTGPGRKPPMRESRAPQLSSGEQSTLRRRGFKPNADGSWESKRYMMRFTSGKGWITQRKS